MIERRAALPQEAVGILLLFAKATMASRPPDFVVGAPDDPYLHRWRLMPRNEHCNAYVHLFLRDDDDRALHDHPYDNVSIVLQHGYMEVLPGPLPESKTQDEKQHARVRMPGDVVFRTAPEAHRVVLIKGPPVSLFFHGQRVREWGFHCPKGWVPWHEFTGADADKPDTSGVVRPGRGCT